MRLISKNQYDLYVSFTRSDLAEFFVEELEWYINESKTLWAVLCFDKQDKNFTVIFSARDENRQIRCVDIKIDFETIDLAREYLFSKSSELEGSLINTQRFKKNINENLFIPIVERSKLNRHFNFIAQSPSHSAARNVINEIMPYFFDVDGNFIEQFQTQGFDSRLWELYLFCYFNEEGLKIDRSHFAPDFCLDKGYDSIGVEAVIVGNREPERIFHKPLTEKEIFEKKKIMPSRWGSPLYSKLKHKDKAGRHYWEYPHTQGKPFVLAIADFHEAFSMTWSQNSLLTYLYGYEYSYSYNDNEELLIHPIKVDLHPRDDGKSPIPSGFFFQKGAENISAVLHSSCATISKFNRIGKQCGLDENNVLMYRIASFFNPNPNASKPLMFGDFVTEENSEPWSEGITIFHNPNAKYPLPIDFFQNAGHCYLKDGFIVTHNPYGLVFSSITISFIEKSKLGNLKEFIKDKDNGA